MSTIRKRTQEPETEAAPLALIPDHYAIASQSGLEFTASESGQNNVPIELHG